MPVNVAAEAVLWTVRRMEDGGEQRSWRRPAVMFGVAGAAMFAGVSLLGLGAPRALAAFVGLGGVVLFAVTTIRVAADETARDPEVDVWASQPEDPSMTDNPWLAGGWPAPNPAEAGLPFGWRRRARRIGDDVEAWLHSMDPGDDQQSR